MFAIIPDFTVMCAVKYKESSFPDANKCREAFEKACSIVIRCDAKLILAEQMLQELKFNDQQRVAIETLAEFDKTTIGAKGQTPQNCVVETAKTWLLKRTIVIDAGQIKLIHPPHHNLKVISPKDFILTCELSTSLKNFVQMDLDRILISLLYRDRAGQDFEELKKLLLAMKK